MNIDFTDKRVLLAVGVGLVAVPYLLKSETPGKFGFNSSDLEFLKLKFEHQENLAGTNKDLTLGRVNANTALGLQRMNNKTDLAEARLSANKDLTLAKIEAGVSKFTTRYTNDTLKQLAKITGNFSLDEAQLQYKLGLKGLANQKYSLITDRIKDDKLFRAEINRQQNDYFAQRAAIRATEPSIFEQVLGGIGTIFSPLKMLFGGSSGSGSGYNVGTSLPGLIGSIFGSGSSATGGGLNLFSQIGSLFGLM